MTADQLAQEVGQRLLKLRQSRALTQEEVATKAKVSTAYIGMLERGDRLPHIDMLFQVASALDVSLACIFEDEDEAEDLAYLRIMAPLLLVVKKLELKPFDILKAARVVWATHAPKGQDKPPV